MNALTEIYRQRAFAAQAVAMAVNRQFDWMLAAEYWGLAGDTENEQHCREQAKKC